MVNKRAPNKKRKPAAKPQPQVSKLKVFFKYLAIVVVVSVTSIYSFIHKEAIQHGVVDSAEATKGFVTKQSNKMFKKTKSVYKEADRKKLEDLIEGN